MIKLDTRTLILISVAVVINIVGGQTVHLLKIPLYLDSIGTLLVGVLAGPVAGGVAGVTTNLIWALILNPVAAAFAPVVGVAGVCAGLLARAGWFATRWKAICSGAMISVPTTIVSVSYSAALPAMDRISPLRICLPSDRRLLNRLRFRLSA